MPRGKRSEPKFKDFDVFTKEVAEAVREGRVLKIKNGWRVFYGEEKGKKEEEKV